MIRRRIRKKPLQRKAKRCGKHVVPKQDIKTRYKNLNVMRRLETLTVMFITTSLMAVLLFGCAKEEPLKYSCDPKVNQWVTENMDAFRNITRKQLSVMPPYLQIPVYRSLPAQQKYEFWMEKLELIMNDWDKPVQDFIEKLTQDINPEWFDETTPDYVMLYIEQAENEILTALMDTSDYIINFCTISTAEEIEYYINNIEHINYSWLPNQEFVSVQIGSRTSEVPDCYCRWNQYCHGFMPDDECKHGGCSTSSSGCGFLNLMSCKGLCPFLESLKPPQR